MSRTLATAAALATVLSGACTVGDPAINDYTKPDASVPVVEPEAPRLTGAAPLRTPLASVALRGKAHGSRIVVEGGAAGPLIKMPLPSGDFCVDVPLLPGATTKITIVTLDAGLISASTALSVTQDATAVQPSNPYCSPSTCQGACPSTESACADGKDNDLDGWTDDCDLDCNGCTDDAFEPNGYPAAVPLLPYDKIHDLMLCPCHDDWFAFYLSVGVTLKVDLTGDPGFNVDMKLFRADDAEKGGYKSNTPLEQATSSNGEEQISWKADKTGMYYLLVYAHDSKQSGGYQLSASSGVTK